MMAILDAAEHVVGPNRNLVDHIAVVTRYRAEELIDPAGRWRHSGRRSKKYLAYWNDKPGQTAANVLAILSRVARGARPAVQP